MNATPELDRLRVVLVAARNPLNIGAAARAMSNFGVSRLRVVNPYSIAFREARSAVGAAALLADAEEYDSISGAVADCSLVVGTTAATNRNLRQALKPLKQAASVIREHLHSSSVAVVFGSEKRGLSNEDFSHCNWLMNIPTREGQKSMNLGQAVAVSLYELTRDDSHGIPKPDKLANSGDLERITGSLLEILHASGYFNPAGAPSSEQNVRRLLRRLAINDADGETILGMLRQISWKLRAGDNR